MIIMLCFGAQNRALSKEFDRFIKSGETLVRVCHMIKNIAHLDNALKLGVLILKFLNLFRHNCGNFKGFLEFCQSLFVLTGMSECHSNVHPGLYELRVNQASNLEMVNGLVVLCDTKEFNSKLQGTKVGSL